MTIGLANGNVVPLFDLLRRRRLGLSTIVPPLAHAANAANSEVTTDAAGALERARQGLPLGASDRARAREIFHRLLGGASVADVLAELGLSK